MMNLVFVVAISLALLFFLWLVSRRGSLDAAGHNGHIIDPSAYLVRLPPRDLLHRFLSPEDIEYAAALNSPALLRRVVQERRKLAAAWLRQTKREAARLFRLHIRSARHAEELRPSAEVKLMFAAGSFLVVYAMMMAAVGLYGPFRTRRFLETIETLADVLSNLGGRIAESIGPSLVPRFDPGAGR